MKINTLSILISIFITALALPHGSRAFGEAVDGTWYYGSTPTSIKVKSPGQLVLDNGEGVEGSVATGYFRGLRKIEVPKWDVTGSIEDGGDTIVWSNGTKWTRFPDHTTHISGRWFHGDRPTSIEVYDNGWRFTIVNENGQRSNGKARSARELYIPSLNTTGLVNKNATRIAWSNGTVWTRTPESHGPLSSPQ